MTDLTALHTLPPLTADSPAFGGNARRQEHARAHARAMYAQDAYAHGSYWNGTQGSAAGAFTHATSCNGSAHLAARLYGFPVKYTHVGDLIFDALPRAEARAFAVAWMHAVPLSADLADVPSRFAAQWIRLVAERSPRLAAQADVVADLIERDIGGEFSRADAIQISLIGDAQRDPYDRELLRFGAHLLTQPYPPGTLPRPRPAEPNWARPAADLFLHLTRTARPA